MPFDGGTTPSNRNLSQVNFNGTKIQVAPDFGASAAQVQTTPPPMAIAKGRMSSTDRQTAWTANTGATGISSRTKSGYISFDDDNSYKPVEIR